jgi:hypothetical protein
MDVFNFVAWLLEQDSLFVRDSLEQGANTGEIRLRKRGEYPIGQGAGCFRLHLLSSTRSDRVDDRRFKDGALRMRTPRKPIVYRRSASYLSARYRAYGKSACRNRVIRNPDNEASPAAYV